MKVKMSTWKERGVTTADLARWGGLNLIRLDDGGMLWTNKSPSSWPKDEKERYYATAGKAMKARGDAMKAQNAQRRAWWGKIVFQYGESVRQVHHRCGPNEYKTSYVNQDGAWNLDGSAHFCEAFPKPTTEGE